MGSFPYTQQLGIRDCGPACLKMVAASHGQMYSIDYLRDKCHITKTGVSLLGISEAAETIGLRSFGVKTDFDKLSKAVQIGPCIVHWRQDHFVVVYKIKKNKVWVADPSKGLSTLPVKEFLQSWIGVDDDDLDVQKTQGYALLLEPTPAFFKPIEEGADRKASFLRLWHYFFPYKKYFIQLIFGMVVGSGISLISPFLTQALVDRGINNQNLPFIYLILFAQLVVFLGSQMVEIIRSWLLLHIGRRINISMVSDFFLKLLNLPIPFFESHVTGDLIQRIGDHKRLEDLLTVSTLSTLFSFLNMAVLGTLLALYSLPIFFIFFGGSVLGFLWIVLFLRSRRNLDFKNFELSSRNSSKTIEILEGYEDIKVSNSARQKRWEWEGIQAEMYKTRIRSLSLQQMQGIGNSVINQLVTIFITVVAAKAVVEGQMTLGTMFAVNMMIGQLSNPVQQLFGFVTSLQDARLSLERIDDVMNQKDEDPPESATLNMVPLNASIQAEKITFNYGSRRLEPVIKNVSFNIPAGKITAIVGASGSGKTTLMKLMLRFYEPLQGSFFLDGVNFKSLHHGLWRQHCGAVMQDGRLFNGTIADNISLGLFKDMEKVMKAAHIANIDEFINTLPMGYMTEIGNNGTSVSEGQKQRILLARAIYKDPEYLFLDEATSSLDANNERVIMRNLNDFFRNRTVVIIAHRLSTVKNADQIIVMNNGEIVETGSHEDLSHRRGAYFELVKNQLELGN